MPAAAPRPSKAAPQAPPPSGPQSRGVAPSGLATPKGLVRVAFEAMGTRVECVLPEGRPDAAAAVQSLFAVWQERLTRFDRTSALSQLNARPAQDVPVSGLLFGAIATALRAAEATAGIFDPTLLRQLEGLGYDRTFGLVEPEAARSPVAATAPQPGGRWRSIRLDAAARTVRLPEGVGIDLGGIAKGMAVDAAADLLAEMGALPGAVDAGGDLAVVGRPAPLAGAAADASTDASADGADDGWPVAIELPAGSHTVVLRGGAIATSGIGRRRWRRAGRWLHHLLDPRTGLPVDNELWSVTVAASRCEQAEVAAKTALILGPEAGPRFLEVNGLAGLLVLADGRTQQVGPWRSPAAAWGA